MLTVYVGGGREEVEWDGEVMTAGAEEGPATGSTSSEGDDEALSAIHPPDMMLRSFVKIPHSRTSA
jgi:hypothetical protein